MSNAEHLRRTLSADAWRESERIIERFQQAWKDDKLPDIAEFLPENAELRQLALARLIQIDLEFRLNAGQDVRVESYLSRFPEFTTDRQAVLDLIGTEYRLRQFATDRQALQDLLRAEQRLPQRSRQSPTFEEYRQRFPEYAPDLSQCLASMKNPDPPTAAFGQTAAPTLAQEATTFANGRFRMEEELGRGGMGVVYRAEDADIGRKVALKLIRRDQAGFEVAQERFRREATVTGRLEHPGIVPVYAMGQDEHGEPYYAMQLVRGESLRTVIDEFNKRDQGRLWRDLTERNLRLRELLNGFVSVCQTVAFAHSKGVIHRDLKPANIQVGKYGETLVLDWGMAGFVKDKDDSPSRAVESLPITVESNSGSTMQGVALGTPAYMSPEQANGHWDIVGPASDVFSLGATLYHMLAGQVPYSGREALTLARKAAFDAPRQHKPGVPKPLEAVCLKAMAKDPKDRYANAEALAADVRQWLGDEPVSAYREPLTAQAGRWARRHKPLVAAFSATLLAVLVLGAMGGWWLDRQRAKTAAKRQETDQNARRVIGDGRELLKTAWLADDDKELSEARARAEKAVEIARNGGASNEVIKEATAFAEEAQAKVAQAKKNQRLRDAILDISEPHEMKTYLRDEKGLMAAQAQSSVEEKFVQAFRRWGVDLDKDNPEDAAALLGDQPERSREEMVAGLDEWALDRRKRNRPEAEWRRLSDLADRLDGNDRRRELRRIRNSEALRTERVQWEIARSLNPWLELADLPIGPNTRQLRELADDLKAEKEPVLGLVSLSRALETAGDARRCEAVLRTGLVAHPDSVVLLDALGKWLERQKPPRRSEAIECYRAARVARPLLGVSLGDALLASNRAADAEQVLRDLLRRQPDNPEALLGLGKCLGTERKQDLAIAAYRQAIALQPDYAQAYNNLGTVLHDQKKLDEAVAAYRQAIALQPNFTKAYYNLGNVLRDQKKLDEAVAAYRQAIALQSNYTPAYYNLGHALDNQKKLDEAVAAFRQAIALQSNFAPAYYELGRVLHDQKKLDEAVAAYRQAIALQPDYAQAYNNLGTVLHDQKKLDEAVAAYRRAIALQSNFAQPYYNLGSVRHDQKKLNEAVAAYRQAIALQPDFAMAYNNLGNALYGQKKLDEAVAAHRQAIEIQPDFALAYINLGIDLSAQKQLDEAIAAYRQAIALQSNSAQAYYSLGNALRDQNKLDEAVAAYRQAIAHQPDFAEVHCNLGLVLRQQGEFANSLAALRQGDQLGSRRNGWHYHSAEWVKTAELLAEMDRKLPAILSGKEKPHNNRELLEFAGFCLTYKHFNRAAARFYADAFAAEPKLADDLKSGSRYDAARAAALAAAGQGKDAAKLDDLERTRLRTQALDWLRADLSQWDKLLDQDLAHNRAAVEQKMRHWQRDFDLAGVHDPDALAKLPAVERENWRKLWADVAALLKKTSEPAK